MLCLLLNSAKTRWEKQFMVEKQAEAGRFDGIDCLRGVAIIAVVAYHFLYRFDADYLGRDWSLTGAPPLWLGVDLFFIVSGFCIAFTLTRSRSATEFWAARFARIQPAYMTCAGITFLVVAAFGLPDREVEATALLANFVWLNATPAAPHVDGVYWSLVVELKFYALLGALWLVFPDGRRLTLAWAALCALSVGMAQISPVIAGISLLFPYNFMFLFGVMLFNWGGLSWTERLGCMGIVALGVASAGRYASEVGGVALVLVLAVTLCRVRRVPGSRWLTTIGVLSYAWYLVHQNIGLVIMREMGMAGLDVLAVPTAVAATLALAWLIHASVELRFRSSAKRLTAVALRALRIEAAAVAAIDMGRHLARGPQGGGALKPARS
jgi:peptidoglycan/LPS O-acetylase OafA/YrhL